MSIGNPSFSVRQWYYKWHRRIAMASALFVVILLVTGILLNHTEGLQLDSRFSDSGLLRKAYGLPARLDIELYSTDQRLISQFEDTIYFDEKAVDTCPGNLVGAVVLSSLAAMPQSFVAACNSGLLWMDSDGEFLDFISADTLNTTSINAIGLNAGNPVIDSETGTLQINLDDLSTRPITEASIIWSQSEPADARTARQLTNAYYREAISWEQILLDMHSGRLFGGWFGVLLMDLSAIILLLLVLSGVYMWWIKRPL